MRSLQTLGLTLALLIGAAAGLHFERQASAGSENLRWMSGVSLNWKYCFGASGWHDTGGTAADLFADQQGPCDDPDQAANPVWAHSFGRSSVWGDYPMLGHGYDGGSIYTSCEDVFVDVLLGIPIGA
jgi:hypothetical protein